ncbi:MAG: DpnD/PcfM family protein [Ignavibacteria bacterium]|nr:DpnD/PcfM family protein [Ignavibacteria bacterium]
MKPFKIEVIETLSRTIEIEANSMDEAYSKVREMYRDEEIVLDSDDYIDTEFIEIEE